MRIFPRNKWLRLLCWAIAPCVALALFVLLSALILWIVGTARLSAEFDKLRAQGGFVSWAEVEATLPRKPTQEEGTRLLREAFDELSKKEVPEEKWKLLPVEGTYSIDEPSDPLPADVAAAVAERIKQMQSVLVKLRRGAPLGARFWTPPKTLSDLPMQDEWPRYRTACRLLALSAIHRVHVGDGDGAVEELISGARLGATLETAPTVIGVLVRVACTGLAAEYSNHVLARSRPSDEVLRSLVSVLQEEEPLSFKFALQTERPFAIMCYDQFDKRQFVELARNFILYDSIMPGYLLHDFLHRDETPTLDALLGGAYPLAGGLIRLNEAKQLDVMRRALGLWHLGLDAVKAEMTAAEKECRMYPLAESAAQLCARLKWAELAHAAHIRCVRAGICAELFRRAKGRLPDKPADLVPEFMSEVPDDPFTGKPLAFDRRHGVLEIYCPSLDTKLSGDDDAKIKHLNSFKLYDKK
ncbi:MAG: hypothetical protein ABIF82_10370 [Planctomycetota bacterium]